MHQQHHRFTGSRFLQERRGGFTIVILYFRTESSSS